MAARISQLSNSFTTYATGNLLVVVDVTDTSMAASGTDKRITLSQFFSNYVFKASGSSHAGGFVPDPGATAGASRYLSENGLWVKPTGVYNVKDYGAVGNGVADDTSAIQAAITAANSAGGGCVYFPATGNTGSAGYLVSSPLIIPRPGNPPIGVVTLRGDATRTSKIVQSSTFPANRSVIEWTLVRSQVWCQSITDLMITLSASVYGGGAIHFQLSATPTSYTDVAAEKGQFELRRLLIETNNPNNPYAIYLEGGHYCCVFEDLIADNGHPSLANPTYDTILLKGSSQVYFNNSDDIPGFFQPVLKNLTATIRRGGYGSIFEGRLNQANFFNAEAQGGRTGPTYKFTNSVQCWLSNLGGEGQSESSQFYFDNCENIICDNIGLGTPDPVYPSWVSGRVTSVDTTVRPTNLGVNNNYFRCTVAGTTGGTEPTWPTGAGDTVVDGSVTWVQEGKATGDGIVLVNTSSCMFRSRASWSTKPTWKSQRGAYVINIDSNSFNNEFVGFCLNGTPDTECIFPTYANRNYGEFWNDIDGTYHVVGTKIPTITTASLPSASTNVGQIVYVPDAAVGAQLQYSNGVGWQPAGPGAALTAPIVSAAPGSTDASAGIAVGTTYYYKVGAVTSTGTELAGPQTGFTLTATRAPNLLSQTIAEDWTVSSWGKVHASAAAGSDVDPVFGNTADKLTEDSTTNNHYATTSLNPGAGAAVFSVYAKSAGRDFLQVYCFSGSTLLNAYVNLSTGAVTNLVAGTFTVTNAGGGWWRIQVNYTAPGSSHSIILFMASAAGTNSYLGDGTSGISLWGALSQTGSGSPPYVDNAVALSWTPSTSAASYNVYRASVSNAFGSPSLLTNTGGTSYTDVGNATTTGSPPGSGDINVGAGGNLNMADPANIVIGTSTGTKIATASSQKLGFFGVSPIIQPSGDIVTALGNLGLVSSPSVTATAGVSSVGLTMPSGFSVSGSPVTTSGTLAVSTTLSGIIKGTGSALAAAVSDTDYPSIASVQSRAISFLKTGSGLYYAVSPAGSVGTGTLGTGTLRVLPFYVPNAVTLLAVVAEVTGAGDSGSTYLLGIWNDNGSGQPGTLLLSCGTIDGASATVQSVSISQALSPGLYWIGGVTQNVTTTQPTLRTVAAGSVNYGFAFNATPTAGQVAVGYAATGVTGSLGNFTGNPGVSSSAPRIFVKVQ